MEDPDHRWLRLDQAAGGSSAATAGEGAGEHLRSLRV